MCKEHAAFKEGYSSREERRKEGGELRLRSSRGKAYGCCSKLPPLHNGQEKRKSVAWVGWDQCVKRKRTGEGDSERVWRHVSWAETCKHESSVISVAWSMLSLWFFYKALQRLGSSRAMVVITALGIIQLSGPSVPPGVLPPLSFLCPPCCLWKGLRQGGQRAVWAWCSVTRSSGWTRSCLARSRGDCEQALTECLGGVGLSSSVYTMCTNSQQQPNLTLPHNNLETRQAISGS